MSARSLQRANRIEGPFVFSRKHKVPHLYSGAGKNAPSLTRFGMTKQVEKRALVSQAIEIAQR
jgi:hypothetical protein